MASSLVYGLDEDGLFKLLGAWDDVSGAIDRVVTSQPAGMTAASENLEQRRQIMRIVINEVTRPPRAAREALKTGEDNG